MLGAGGDIKIVTQTGIGVSDRTFASQVGGCHIAHSGHFAVEWRNKLRRFLSPLAPEIRHRDVADRLTQGTGKWFLERPEFKSWLGQPEVEAVQVLCCIGNPGAGKTGLAYVVSFAVCWIFSEDCPIDACPSKRCIDCNSLTIRFSHSYIAITQFKENKLRPILLDPSSDN